MPALYEDALVYETGTAITSTGALSAYSGAKTGRSPADKRVVKEEGSEKEIWWGPVNKAMTPEVSDHHLSHPQTSIVIHLELFGGVSGSCHFITELGLSFGSRVSAVVGRFRQALRDHVRGNVDTN